MSRVIFRSSTDRWATPPDVYDALHREFTFDFDPCPLDGDEDGLSPLYCSWKGKRVFCNPPYGPQIRHWLSRAPEADVAVYLLPSRTDSPWFHDLVLPRANEVRFVRGRLRFSDTKQRAPFPSMIVIFQKG